MKKRLLIAGCVLAWMVGASFGAVFQNLDFESVELVPSPDPPSPWSGPLTNAITRAWIVYAGTNAFPEPSLPLNHGGVDGVVAEVVDLRGTQATFTNFVDGNFAIYFHQDFVGNSPFAIAQMATVPLDAKFLRFKVAGATGFRVTLNGTLPPLVEDVPEVFLTSIQQNVEQFIAHHKVYDVSAFTGQDVELRFTLHAPVPNGPFGAMGDGILDSITFLRDYSHFDSPATKFGPNGFVLSWVSLPSSKFQVEFTTNIRPVWQAIGTPVSSTTSNFSFIDTAVTNQSVDQRFYRLRTVP